MKKIKLLIIVINIVVLWTFTACTTGQEDKRTVIKKPGKTITVIDNDDSKYMLPPIYTKKLIPFYVVEITDWLDDQNLIVVMENKELKKMNLRGSSQYYSRGIYQYNIETMEIKPLKVRENMFLGGAKLSPDKKHLLYYDYSTEDTTYYVMSMNDSEQMDVEEEILSLAMTAHWTEDNNIIGVSYDGGAYTADTSLKPEPAFDLQDERLLTIVKAQNKVYYITIADSLDMYVLDLNTNLKKKLNIENADGIIPSLDGCQILITQSTETARKLLVADTSGNILRTIAEGTEISGVSWSPDQMMIAYQLRTIVNGVDSRELYIYDVLEDNSTRIAVNYSAVDINWSPSGDKIAVSQFNVTGYINPSIFYLERNK